MNVALRALAKICAEFRLEKKYLLVPSYQVGHQIGEALAREGGSWVNLHFVTLVSLAQQAAGEELLKRGTKLISSTHCLFIVEKIFRELKERGRLEYFGRLEATTGIVRALRSSIYDLRMAGLRSSDLSPSDFIDKRKGEEVTLLLFSYEQELKRAKQVDLAGIYELAIARIEAGQGEKKDRKKELYLCLQDQPLEHLERKFLETLAGKNLVLVPQDPVYGLVRPPEARGAALEGTPCPTPASDIERLPWLFATAKAPPPFRDETIDIFSAVGPTNECREIVRRLLASNIPFDDVELIHPPDSTYPSIMYSLAQKSGFRMTFGDGIPLAFTSPGKAFNGLIDWLEHNYLATDLCALIEAGVLKLPSPGGNTTLTPLKASRYLKSAMIGWGRDRYVPRLETMVEDIRVSALSDEREDEEGKTTEIGMTRDEREERAAQKIKEVETLVAFVREILELLPDADEEGKVDFASLCRGAAAFINKFSALYGELDAEARGLLLSRLAEAGALKVAPLKLDVALEWLKNLAAALRVGASGPRPGHVHLSSWRNGGVSDRSLTFVVGLDQAAFPGAGIQDPILLDEERERISGELRTSADSLRQNLWRMAGMLAGLRGKVVLSYSSYDIIEERQSFPSSLILQAARLRSGDPSLDYSALAQHVPAGRGFLPEVEVREVRREPEGKEKVKKKDEKWKEEERKRAERTAWEIRTDMATGTVETTTRRRAIDETDWWLGQLAPGGLLRDGMEAVKANFELLSRGIFAAEKRRRPLVSAFEGKVKVAPDETCPLSNPEIIMSASRFERLARCPFSYFLEYILDVRPPEELELDLSRWLDPMQRGSLLHEIFALFMKELKKRGEMARLERHASLIRRIGAEVIARYREEIPPPSEGIFEREKKAIEDELEVFLKTEASREKPVQPILFEVSFGGRPGKAKLREKEGETRPRRRAKQGVEEEASEAIVIRWGKERAFLMAGRIDRIDRLEEGCYRVVDYKTGSSSPFEKFKEFGRGRFLQHALYAIAAEVILRSRGIDSEAVVVESGYYFPTRKGEGKEVIVEKFNRKKLAALLDELLEVLSRGWFVVNPEAECDFCDFTPVCRSTNARQRAKEKKLDNRKIFSVFERLKEYD